MTMDADVLAKDIWDINGEVKDGDGIIIGPPDGLTKYCQGFIAMVSVGIVSHLPGTITGSAAPGAPLLAGAASGGKVVGLLGLTMSAIAADPIVAPAMTQEADVIAGYIMASGLVSFQTGSIEGNSTETANPGPLAVGRGTQGRFTGLTGAALANLVSAATGTTGPKIIDQFDIMMNHLMDNAEVTYLPNTVLGIMTGGSLTVGAGAGGTIT